MAIYKLGNKSLSKLSRTTFSKEGIGEVKDLQHSIINSIEVIEKDLFVLCNEFGDWEESNRRIDILCLDKNANLVVIELKATDDGGHMELQALRYAAMVSNMTFDKAVKAYQGYASKNNITLTTTAEDTILNFLEWDDANKETFAHDVRIILVSADFSKEITTTVLWLQNNNIDIKCIRIKPQKDGDNVYIDIQQIIPLPETADFQVRLREKVEEQRIARRESSRDYSRFDVSVGGICKQNLNKRQAIYFVISECVKNGISPEDLQQITTDRRWLSVNKDCQSTKDFELEYQQSANKRKYDPSRWFNAEGELIRYNGKTYLFSNQHGSTTFDMAKAIFEQFNEVNGNITIRE